MQSLTSANETALPKGMAMTTTSSRQAAPYLSAYDRYATECRIYGITPRPIGEWFSLPSEGTAEMKHEARVKAENAAATVTASTVVTVAPVRHAAATVRRLRTLAEVRAERATKSALRRERLRVAVDRIAEKCDKTHNPSPNRPSARAEAMAERERWIAATLPLIVDAIGLEGAEGVRLARSVAEAWLERRELDTERRVSRGYQERLWREMPSTGWKGMSLGVTPEDTVANCRNGLRATAHRGHDCGSGLYSSIAPMTEDELQTLRLTVEHANSLWTERHGDFRRRRGSWVNRLWKSEDNPMMEA